VNAVCPTCRSNGRVIYKGRQGEKGPSQDVWQCRDHGRFTTTAR
jgi:hypothetical protein